MLALNGLHSPLETALILLDLGLRPIPLHPLGSILAGGKISKGKEPIGAAWGEIKPNEINLRARFRKYPGAGVGLLLGPVGGIVDLEVDGPEGEESLLRLLGGEIIRTMSWSSRRGPHNPFRWDARLATCNKSILKLPQYPGLEIRLGHIGKQLQSAVPPTPGEDGQPRVWTGYEIAALPECAIEILLVGAGHVETLVAEPSATPNGPPAEARVTTARPSAVDRCRAYLAKVVAGVQGQNGSIPMMRAACLIPRFGIENGPTAYQLLSEYGAKCDPAWTDEAEINHKLDDAFKLETRRDFVDQDPPEWEGRGQQNQVGESPPVVEATPKDALSGSPSDAKEKAKREPDPTQADILLKIASIATLFRDDGNKTYAAVPVSGHIEVHAIYSTSFGQWLGCPV